MGDFNTDGKRIDQWTGDAEIQKNGPYRDLLQTLRIGPLVEAFAQPYEADSCLPSLLDTINRTVDDFDWDVDHGDVARQRTVHPIRWCTPQAWEGGDYMTGAGTDIGAWNGHVIAPDGPYEDDGADDYYSHVGNFDGTERYDYILVRPPYAPDDPAITVPRWIVGQGSGGGADQWSSPWPGNDGLGDPPPARLSDHKPVTVTLKHVPLAFPDAFHPAWKHGVTFRVTNADASNVSDCLGCDALDLQARGLQGRVLDNGSWMPLFLGPGTECTDDSSVALPADCLLDWSWVSTQASADVTAHQFMVGLMDVDLTTGTEDYLPTCQWRDLPAFPHMDDIAMLLEWSPGSVKLRGYDQPTVECGDADADRDVVDNEPVRACSADASPLLCVEADIDELPPGDQ